MTFAEKLRELREAAGISREELALTSGLKRGTIRDYEQGKREPSLRSAVKLAGALGADCRVFAECVREEESPTSGGHKTARAKSPAQKAKPGGSRARACT